MTRLAAHTILSAPHVRAETYWRWWLSCVALDGTAGLADPGDRFRAAAAGSRWLEWCCGVVGEA